MGKPSSMDTKYKDDLFRKYVQFHEGKVDATPSKQRPGNDEYLRVAASTLLSLHKVDPFYRFRLIQFYEVVESSLRSLSSSSLRALACAFSVLETVGVNLFLYPWKKEFRSIKTYTGPFVYYVKSSLLEEDIRAILHYMGYVPELGTAYKLKELVETLQVKMVSFELFLAKVECEQMLEIHSQVKDKGYSELDVVSERKSSAEDVRGCSEALRRRPSAPATSRCGFCNRPGAANTCTQCSKVSCDTCLGAYHYDPCCKKSELHKFMPNNQLNYKSTQLSHLVYR
uniref:Spermatogenesis-associated protein 2 n=1 Tax=Panthera tigris altaica TaxID=74533 RepID=A0A8C9JZG5_PANTA